MSDAYLYRVYDNQFMGYVGGHNGRSTWLRKCHAERIAERANRFREGTRRPLCVVHTFKLVKVEEE